jgi:hypothetical protein
MQQYKLDVINLHNRPYMHGTSILKGIISIIENNFIDVSDFEIRFKHQLYSQPVVCITDELVAGAVFGTFRMNNKICHFHLIETSTALSYSPDADIDLLYDEDVIGNRMFETDTEYYLDITPADDLHLCYNIVSKLSNMILFEKVLELSPKKHTWLVGYQLPTLDFLNKKTGRLGISKDFTMVAHNCMKRQITFNNVIAGHRLCIYA